MLPYERDQFLDSLKYLGIIQLGNHAENKQSRKGYPKELVSQTNLTIKMGELDAFERFSSFYSQQVHFDELLTTFFKQAVSLDACYKFLAKNHLGVLNTNDHHLPFVFLIVHDLVSVQTLKVYFIHAFQDCIRPWSFSLVGNELYVLNPVDSAIFPIGILDEHSSSWQISQPPLLKKSMSIIPMSRPLTVITLKVISQILVISSGG